MSIEFATSLLNSIIDCEDKNNSKLELKLVETNDNSCTNICFANNTEDTNKCSNPVLIKEDNLFTCHNDLPLYCLFSFECPISLTIFFKEVGEDKNFGVFWFNVLIKKVKQQVGLELFNELLSSVLIELSVRFSDLEGLIVFRFSKHSFCFNKNIHFELQFDMDFNFRLANFCPQSYQDNYQMDTLIKFRKDNQLIAFHTLLSYYSRIEVHQHFNEILNVSSELNDENLLSYNDLANMILI